MPVAQRVAKLGQRSRAALPFVLRLRRTNLVRAVTNSGLFLRRSFTNYAERGCGYVGAAHRAICSQ
jgi:hypothetical protein